MCTTICDSRHRVHALSFNAFLAYEEEGALSDMARELIVLEVLCEGDFQLFKII